jgi:hypothetical protein
MSNWAKLHPEEAREYRRLQYERTKELVKSRAKTWASQNRQRRLEIQKKYRDANKEKIRAWRIPYLKQRLDTDLSFKIRKYLGNRIRYAVKGKWKAGRTHEFLGCSIPDFRIYLESKFTPEMSWDNYGGVWEIDHIMPCAIFDLSKPEHQKRCFHFSNLQPLIKLDNRRKRGTVTTNQYPLL